jgi:biopolymer transport protein ExbD
MRLSRYRPNRATRIELSGTSLIDVVFLLLIFFMTTTTFVSPERQLLPAIHVERSSAGQSSRNIEPLEIRITARDGAGVFLVGTTETPEIALIRPILENWPDKSAGAWIRLAEDAPFGLAALAINACEDAGFRAISMVPLPQEPEGAVEN